MKIWIDAQLSPEIAVWIAAEFGFKAVAIRDLGLREAEDPDIFQAARVADAIVMTKDRDFLLLQNQFGHPPRIIWLTCGNTSNKRLKEILLQALSESVTLLESGEIIVQINSPS